MPTTKFRRSGEKGNYEYKEIVTHSKEMETHLSTTFTDNELVGLETRIKDLKARKKALASFISKDISEGEEGYDSSQGEVE